MITIEQCRAARGLLDWTQQDLSDASGLSKTAINNFEKGHSDIKRESQRAIRLAFESADIEFIGEEGLKKNAENASLLKGPYMYGTLAEDIANTLQHYDSELIMFNISVQVMSHLPKSLKQNNSKNHNFAKRIICSEGAAVKAEDNIEIRWSPQSPQPTGLPTFIYGPKLAVQLWDESMIIVINSQEAAQAERRRFERLWSGSIVPDAESNDQSEKARSKTA